MFRVTKTLDSLSEHAKLEFIKVKSPAVASLVGSTSRLLSVQEIGFTHMRILEGVQTYLQLSGCVARLCKINMNPHLFTPSK